MAQDDAATDETTNGTSERTQSRPGRQTAGKSRPATKATPRKASATAEAPRRPRAGAIAREAVSQLYELTGHEIEAITGVHRDGDGWVVEVDVLELRRVPATTDVLATYEVEMDDSGDLTGYRRKHRFVRGNVGEDR